MGFELTRFIGTVDIEFICILCAKVLDNPMQSTCSCEHLFCHECIKTWLAVIGMSCPFDRTILDTDALKPAAKHFRNLLGKLEIRCDYRKQF